jgi:hypothetical protein
MLGSALVGSTLEMPRDYLRSRVDLRRLQDTTRIH